MALFRRIPFARIGKKSTFVAKFFAAADDDDAASE